MTHVTILRSVDFTPTEERASFDVTLIMWGKHVVTEATLGSLINVSVSLYNALVFT